MGNFEGAVEETLQKLDAQDFAARVWKKDPSAWKDDPAVQAKISNRLGWLEVVSQMQSELPRIKALAEQVRDEGYKNVVLLGMGGSSLAPEVMRQTFGNTPGYPTMYVVDTTDPGFIAQIEAKAPPADTLYVVSSKSGTTLEPNTFYSYFYHKVKELKGVAAGESFVAVTDPGSQLAQIGREKGFREVFLNPADIGGRYSALSFFGLVPAAIAGYDVEELLKRGVAMANLTKGKGKGNPGLSLGAIMGACAKAGVDKITFAPPKSLSSFGIWAEQLIAESTGKEERGIVPIAGEDLGAPEVYSNDRLFVGFQLATEPDEAAAKKLEALAQAGHPVVTLTLQDKFDLAAEFFRWEFATGVAGALLEINPFDEPNVQESKDNTNRLLGEFKSAGKLPRPEAISHEGNLTLYGDAGTSGTLAEQLAGLLAQAKAGVDYVAFLAYVTESAEVDAALHTLRQYVRDSLKVATTIGYGPRFLHSTGQLHKGGANNGVYIQITQDDHKDLPIPEYPFSFSTLKGAQALGDLQSLQSHGRRALSVNLADLDKGFAELIAALKA